MVFPRRDPAAAFFDFAADAAVNYGGIGATIGHGNESTDSTMRGASSTAPASSPRGGPMRTPRQFTGARRRARPTIRRLRSRFRASYVKGDLTMGENIADLGGALVALDAYHDSLGGRPAPVIDGLTGDQRFFLSYAQTWRDKSTGRTRSASRSCPNAHAPVQYRVNGVVRNMDAWYRSFDVLAGRRLAVSRTGEPGGNESGEAG